MSWVREEVPGHEGFVVGFVPRDGCTRGSGLYRELHYPADTDARDVVMLSAGCECGWRSSHFAPTATATWAPFSVLASDSDELRARVLWAHHVAEIETSSLDEELRS